MSRVNLNYLKQKATAVESCVKDIENSCLNEYGEETEAAEDLRNNWDELYSVILDIHEILTDLVEEVEK